jgi:hypothetical protein
MSNTIVPKFLLGSVVTTAGVARLVAHGKINVEFLQDSLMRHIQGDWGDMDCDDKEINNWSLMNGKRLLSRYSHEERRNIYIITEHDRSITTILLPEEY